MQRGVDEAAEHHGDQGKGENAQPVHQGTHETAGLFRRRRGRSVVSFVGHSSIPKRGHMPHFGSSKFYARRFLSHFIDNIQLLTTRRGGGAPPPTAHKLTLTRYSRAHPAPTTPCHLS